MNKLFLIKLLIKMCLLIPNFFSYCQCKQQHQDFYVKNNHYICKIQEISFLADIICDCCIFLGIKCCKMLSNLNHFFKCPERYKIEIIRFCTL